MNRRQFTAGLMIVPRHVLGGQGHVAPSDRITIGCVGMGHQGFAVLFGLLARPDVQITSVCDCNKGSLDYVEYSPNALMNNARRLLGKGYENWAEDLNSPGSVNLTPAFRTSVGMGGREPAKRLVEAYYASRNESSYKGCSAYSDYRELLEKEKDLDAVYVATPDHWHAPIALAAMRRGKHVLCQKPMTHSVGEARKMAEAAQQTKVATAVTINNPSTPQSRLIKQWLDDGAIGRVREVHNWSSRPFWPQGVARPESSMPVPAGLDWDMWLGPAPERPFHSIYHPFSWRGWYDFGCGSFGDMGCYSFAGLFHILNLAPPTAVESSTSESHKETYPKASMVHVDFPSVRLSWYDGGLTPRRPAGLKPEDEKRFRKGQEGVMYVGDKGLLIAGFNGEGPRVYPESSKYESKPESREYGDEAVDQWIAACKGGPEPRTSFAQQSPVTESFLLGCIAQRMPGERLVWDSTNMKITSSEAANAFVDPPWRGNWS